MKTLSLLFLLLFSSQLLLAEEKNSIEYKKVVSCYASNNSQGDRPGFLDTFTLYVDKKNLKHVKNLNSLKAFPNIEESISAQIGVRGINQSKDVFTVDAKMYFDEALDDVCYQCKGYLRIAIAGNDENLKTIISENPRLNNNFKVSFYADLTERLSPKVLTLFGFPETYDCESFINEQE